MLKFTFLRTVKVSCVFNSPIKKEYLGEINFWKPYKRNHAPVYETRVKIILQSSKLTSILAITRDMQQKIYYVHGLTVYKLWILMYGIMLFVLLRFVIFTVRKNLSGFKEMWVEFWKVHKKSKGSSRGRKHKLFTQGIGSRENNV